MAMKRIVLTGGPGAGKSTLATALARRGVSVFEEAGRAIMRLQDAVAGPAHPARSPRAYAEAMLQWDMRSWSEAAGSDSLAIFDRGVPDTIGYLNLIGHPVPPHMERAAIAFRYDDPVFVAPPWREIYVTDPLRMQQWDEAVATHDAVRAVYLRLNYVVVDLPLLSPEERADFLLARVG